MPRRLPSLSALRAFEAAARLGRMTAAAEELSVSPGAISRQVRLLEDHLGTPLFDGTKARPTLTAAARALQPVLTAAFQQIADTVSALSDARFRPLDVACFSTFTVKWLIPRLFDFHAQHPGIEVRLQTTDTGTDAAREGCDLLITVQEPTAAIDAAARPLLTECLGPVMSPAFAARIGALRTPADLAGQPLLHTRMRRDAWPAWAASNGTVCCDIVDASGPVYEHYYFTLEAAVRGLGIAVAPWHLVVDDIQADRLVAPFGFSPSGFEYVLKRRGSVAHPGLDIFCNWLVSQAQAMPLPRSNGFTEDSKPLAIT